MTAVLWATVLSIALGALLVVEHILPIVQRYWALYLAHDGGVIQMRLRARDGHFFSQGQLYQFYADKTVCYTGPSLKRYHGDLLLYEIKGAFFHLTPEYWPYVAQLDLTLASHLSLSEHNLLWQELLELKSALDGHWEGISTAQALSLQEQSALILTYC